MALSGHSLLHRKCPLLGLSEPSQRHAGATEKRGGNPDVKQKPEREKPKDAMERKLEQGLEESMTGSDPVSVTQPPKNKHDEKKEG